MLCSSTQKVCQDSIKTAHGHYEAVLDKLLWNLFLVPEEVTLNMALYLW